MYKNTGQSCGSMSGNVSDQTDIIHSWKALKESRLVGMTQRYITKCQHRERGECVQYTRGGGKSMGQRC